MVHRPHRKATDLLRQDNQRVRDLFVAFEESMDLAEQKDVIQNLTDELGIHTQLAEAILHPALLRSAHVEHLIDEAQEEHQEFHAIVEDLQAIDHRDPMFSDKFIELEDKVLNHLQNEEAELLLHAEDAGLDLDELGEEMLKLRERLLQQRAAEHPPSPKRKRRTVPG
jgi:hypothetical protein